MMTSGARFSVAAVVATLQFMLFTQSLSVCASVVSEIESNGKWGRPGAMVKFGMLPVHPVSIEFMST